MTTPDYFTSRLFGDGVGSPPYDSLRDFYLRSSYNQLTVEGNVLDPALSSFVGLHPIPVRHGMTIGELAKMFLFLSRSR